MAKRLILLRHAKSSWKRLELADFDRPLSGRGKRDAPAMGLRLKAWGACPDLILSSPAKRARKTAKIVAEALGYPGKAIRCDERLYLQGVQALLAALTETDDRFDEVMLVGHNPDITELAERLTGDDFSEIPTAGAVVIRVEGTSWRELARFGGGTLWFDYPKKHSPANAPS
ncbi:SixA phosphatase family protein [Methylogaea oryzae]|uniref:Phosphoglycerate mutase n=1 Tax=Methylogaea oryzae TaxID=1295382 RepID=A0A8D5AJE9_9GAMM|nr:histidine phosphatase family protein [Methylogaea oryzae]BBL72341.1 phosphoglycerate mutase [Methylogaea oryzae]